MVNETLLNELLVNMVDNKSVFSAVLCGLLI